MMYTDSSGKQWEVVGIREAKAGEHYISTDGRINSCCATLTVGIYPIVRPIVPEYITPTDEHAKQRPMVEVRNDERCSWNERKLVYVGGNDFKFHTYRLGAHFVAAWKFCRMRNPEYVDNKGE